MTDGTPALELSGIARRFGETVALDGVDFVALPGRVHALLGENGAGKSTLMRIAYGVLRPDAGTVKLFGEPRLAATARAAVHAGVGMVHQQLSLVPNLPVVENLVLGDRGRFRPAEAERRLRQTMEASGLSVPVTALAGELTVVQQQRLEILKALARRARLLILDEPTAMLAPADIDELLRWIRSFASQGGSVVLVTHKLREALAVSDQITVLRRGRVVLRSPASETSAEALARTMFPEPPERAATPGARPGETIASANAIAVDDELGVRRLRNATFVLRRHEIVGVAAVEGSGHSELLAALAGSRPVASGTLELPPRLAVIPADRMRDALIADFSLTENVALRGLGNRRGLMPWGALARRTGEILRRFAITASSPNAPARSLSGGNQQRLVVARELEEDVDLVIADNPTRGLDVQAASFVLDALRDAAARGATVAIHSSDLDELLSVATRVLVVYHGTVTETPPDRDLVGRAMLGAAAAA